METHAPTDSRAQLSMFMMPEHANTHGNVHGGWIMKLVDEVGGIAAMRHSRRPCVTVAIDSMTFDAPVRVGDLVTLEACVTWVGRTSMETMVHVHAENLLSGARTLTNTAFLVYVALDETGTPAAVPTLTLTNEVEQRRFEQGRQRQQERLARHQRDQQA